MKKLSPMNARTLDQMCKLRTDNFSTPTHWIIADGYSVSVVAQKPGEGPTQCVQIDRKTFNRLIRWYLREQAVRTGK